MIQGAGSLYLERREEVSMSYQHTGGEYGPVFVKNHGDIGKF